MAGVRDLLREEEQKGGRVAERVAALRERLRRQFSRQVHRVDREYRARQEELKLRQEEQKKLLEDEIGRLQASLARAKQLSGKDVQADPELLAAVRSALVLPSEALRAASQEVTPTLWQRLRAFFHRLYLALLRLFGRVPQEPPKRKPSPGRPVAIGRLSALGRTLSPANAGDVFGEMTPEQLNALQASTEEQLRQKVRAARDGRKEAESDAQRKASALAQEAEAARKEAERRAEERARSGVERQVGEELRDRGWVREKGGQMAITYALVEKFARLVLEEESRSFPEGLRMSLRGSASTGLYEKGRLRQLDEVARLDLVSSLVESRSRGSPHLLEEASYVYREVRSESLHAVLLLDTSGSMAQGDKLPAAKKALLALYMAVHRRYPDATIDVATFDNDLKVLDLVSLWEAKPGSFTNTGEALHVAHQLLRSSKATRKEVYLVTDGLPESYTDDDGKVRSGNLVKAQEYALRRAGELRTVTPLASTIVLLKSSDPSFEKAARDLARVLGGSVVITDPKRLAFELLVRFVGGRPTERAAPAGPAEPEARSRPAEKSTDASSVLPGGGSARDRRKARRAAALQGGAPAGGG